MLLIPGLLALSLPAAAAEVHGYRVVRSYPHDPQAFTQGLVFLAGDLYEGTGRQGHSELRRVDLDSGKVLSSLPLPDRYFGEGITVWDGHIIQLTWRSGIAFVYDLGSWKQVAEFRYATEGWGITHDDAHLIMSDGSSKLRFLDPLTYEEVRRIEVTDQGEPVTRLNELEYVKGEIWANVWHTDQIVRIAPADGRVIGTIDLRGLLSVEERAAANVLNGIAYDETDDRIFVTGKLWPKLFEIELVPGH